MNTFSDKITKFIKNRQLTSILRALLVSVFLLTLYHGLVSGGMIQPSNGFSQWETNVIKIQRYVYNNKHNLRMILVGSSIAARIKPEYIGNNVANLAMSALSSQTGLEIIKRSKFKPSILLIELNHTIQREISNKIIDSVYQPALYWLRFYFPMFRQEYQPVSTFLEQVKKINNQSSMEEDVSNKETEKINWRLREELISRTANGWRQPLSKEIEEKIRKEAEYIKKQISEIKKFNVKIVLFNVPGEMRVEQTIYQQQVQKLLKELFPPDTFEWLPQPPSQEWKTRDGIHLTVAHAKKYAAFVRQELLNTAF
ncbi:MAG TPA: hypothetical protein V6D28_04555 [Leptolyngbyaceae cyanobacterium]